MTGFDETVPPSDDPTEDENAVSPVDREHREPAADDDASEGVEAEE